jgi:hypothetical protein
MAKGRVIRGAPPASSRTVLSETKSARYIGGDHPGALSARRGQSTMGRVFDVDAPTIDAVIPGHGNQPDRNGTSKAAEVAAHDPSYGLGVTLDDGPLGRATRAGR